MTSFTKISIALLFVGAAALAAFGVQVLRSPADENTLPVQISPSPKVNPLIGSLDKAKNVQNIQDNRFDESSDVLTVREITAQQVPKDSYIVSGTVIADNTCPPCPKGSEGLCAPCPSNTFTIADSKNDQLTIRANSSYPVKVGTSYLFTISGNANSGWSLISTKPQ